MQKKQLLKRVQEAETRATQTGSIHLRQLAKAMTTDELREIVYGAPTEKRFEEIIEAAERRLKA